MGANTEYAVLDMLEKQKLDEIMNGGGGGGIMVVSFSHETADTDTYVADKTFAEVSSAIESGQYVVGFSTDINEYLPLKYYEQNQGLYFMSLSYLPGGIGAVMFAMLANDTIIYNEAQEEIGSNELVVTFTVDTSGQGYAITADKTFAEIAEAIGNGVNVQCIVPSNAEPTAVGNALCYGSLVTYSPNVLQDEVEYGMIVFSVEDFFANKDRYWIYMLSDGTIDVD